ncbi:hypothetical protein QR680_007191 [Steinernema hermaphroditum]|uniref:Ubiquitin-like protease family profile domain-containing protein n=1 Tax=Steinernema hermaphroditum TaxID=289476 RepID=A0AA39HY25_9BILA|nr:hypothetical protein QR680_007191 [Steinernema hermaphroditum]
MNTRFQERQDQLAPIIKEERFELMAMNQCKIDYRQRFPDEDANEPPPPERVCILKLMVVKPRPEDIFVEHKYVYQVRWLRRHRPLTCKTQEEHIVTHDKMEWLDENYERDLFDAPQEVGKELFTSNYKEDNWLDTSFVNTSTWSSVNFSLDSSMVTVADDHSTHAAPAVAVHEPLAQAHYSGMSIRETVNPSSRAALQHKSRKARTAQPQRAGPEPVVVVNEIMMAEHRHHVKHVADSVLESFVMGVVGSSVGTRRVRQKSVGVRRKGPYRSPEEQADFDLERILHEDLDFVQPEQRKKIETISDCAKREALLEAFDRHIAMNRARPILARVKDIADDVVQNVWEQQGLHMGATVSDDLWQRICVEHPEVPPSYRGELARAINHRMACMRTMKKADMTRYVKSVEKGYKSALKKRGIPRMFRFLVKCPQHEEALGRVRSMFYGTSTADQEARRLASQKMEKDLAKRRGEIMHEEQKALMQEFVAEAKLAEMNTGLIPVPLRQGNEKDVEKVARLGELKTQLELAANPELQKVKGMAMIARLKKALHISGGGRKRKQSVKATEKDARQAPDASTSEVGRANIESTSNVEAEHLEICPLQHLGNLSNAAGFDGRDLISMGPKKWLSGGPIGRILCDEINALNRTLPPHERTAVADSMFWGYNYNRYLGTRREYDDMLRGVVRESMSLVQHDGVMTFARVIMPVHINESHWAVGILNVQRKEIIVYDSLQSGGEAEIKKGLQEFAAHILNETLNANVRPSAFAVQFAAPNMRMQQRDCYNCGVHSIDNALRYLKAVPQPEREHVRVVDVRDPDVVDVRSYANNLREVYRTQLMRKYPTTITQAIQNFEQDIIEARRIQLLRSGEQQPDSSSRSIVDVDSQNQEISRPEVPMMTYSQAVDKEKMTIADRREFLQFQQRLNAQEVVSDEPAATIVRQRVEQQKEETRSRVANDSNVSKIAAGQEPRSANPTVADLLSQMRRCEEADSTQQKEDSQECTAVSEGMDFLRSQMKGYEVFGTSEHGLGSGDDGATTSQQEAHRAKQQRYWSKNKQTIHSKQKEHIAVKRLSQTAEEKAAADEQRRATRKPLTGDQKGKKVEYEKRRVKKIKKEEEEDAKRKEKMIALNPLSPVLKGVKAVGKKLGLKMDAASIKRREKYANVSPRKRQLMNNMRTERRLATKRKLEVEARDDVADQPATNVFDQVTCPQDLMALAAAATQDPANFVATLEMLKTGEDLKGRASTGRRSIDGPPARKRRRKEGLSNIHYKTCPLDHPGRGCASCASNHRVPPWSPSGFIVPCKYCGARMTEQEERRQWKGCCHEGKVHTQQMRQTFDVLQNPPQFFKELTDPVHVKAKPYLKNDRKVNAHFAMGSITTHRDTTLPRGPNVVKINNDMETRLSDLRRSSKHEQPTFGQYYALTSEEAMKYRLQTDLGKGELGVGGVHESVIGEIDRLLRDNHALAKLYRFSSEKFEEACKEAELKNEPIPSFKMTILNNREAKLAGIQDKDIHLHRTEIPTSEQVAVIWISNDDNAKPPDFAGIDLHNKPDGTVNMGTRGSVPHVLPACFPLLDPFGLPGYRFGIPNKIKEDADRMAQEQAAEAIEAEADNVETDLYEDPVLFSQGQIVDAAEKEPAEVKADVFYDCAETEAELEAMEKDAYNCGIHTMYNAIYFAEQLHRDSHPGPGAYDLRMPEGTDINELRPIIKAELLEHLAPELDHTPEMDNSDEDEVIELRPRTVQQLAPVLERLALESEHVDENEPLQLPAGMAPDVEMAVLNKAPHFPPEFEQLEEELKQLTPDVEVDDDLYELPPELKAKILGPDWQQRSVPKGKRARPPDVQFRVIPADPAHFERIERELLDHSDDDDVFEDCHE